MSQIVVSALYHFVTLHEKNAQRKNNRRVLVVYC